MRRFLFVLAAVAPILSAQNWSAWRPDPVYHGIQTREHCAGFNEFAGRYIWDVQLRNDYHKDVDFSWSAEPGLLHGTEAQTDHAMAVRPGEVVETHHTAPNACTAGMAVRINEVKDSGGMAQAHPNSAPPPQGTSSFRPTISGRWASKDPEPLRKELVVELSGRTVTSSFSSPGFSIQVSTPLPEGVSGSVSLSGGDHKQP